MKIGILSRNPKIYSTHRLVKAAISRGHKVKVINPLRCYMNITSSKPMVHYKDQMLDDLDVIVPRIGASITYYGTAVLRQFEMMGVYSMNESTSITRSRDKLRCLQILSRSGIGLPTTSYAHSTKMTEKLIKMVGGAPCVIKLIEGTQGKGVILGDTAKSAESVIDGFRQMKAHFLVQEFIKECNGSDIRAFVIGDKVVASMMRQAKEGEFRSNLHRGGSAVPVKISEEEAAMAVNAAKALGLNVAGVDLLRSHRGPLVLEVNSSPGLQGIETSTGLDIASMMIEYIEQNVGKRDYAG
ncbi:30S ribosomal protein S6--L-glutamate ligase [Peredibacter starrii]|uniref:Probable alpha-L-glutamate ligase n=1 Tax=Peredibacter starrii TaxID=28202 RepID=A0AAX4HL82_9BACT|nr:30S ribosomal protein S6--L-glutamate ligase [Peredibacter starrii]WPU63986.1 30S ribosomal protein S6--L-glutamate ligase [Peredibacter starrii]